MFVYPASFELDSLDLPKISEGFEQSEEIEKKGEGPLLYGVREYHVSDNPKRIHWKASAKRSSFGEEGRPGWLVREMQPDQDQEINLLWPDLKRSWSLSKEAVESFISYTSSLIDVYDEKGIKTNLLIQLGESFFQVRHSESMNDSQLMQEYLSLLEWDRPQESRSINYLERTSPLRFVANSIDVFPTYESWSKKERHS